MNNYQVTKQLYVDAVPVAEMIEAQLGQYLQPAESGLYLPTSAKPVMLANHHYYQRVNENGLVKISVIAKLEDIQGEVCDRDGVVVVPKALVKRLSLEPIVPARGLAVLCSAVDWVLTTCAAWSKRTPDLNVLLEQHLREEYRGNEVVLERLSTLALQVRGQVRAFIGEDTWVMFFHRLAGRDIVVERTVDFRIFDWERRMSAGEWK